MVSSLHDACTFPDLVYVQSSADGYRDGWIAEGSVPDLRSSFLSKVSGSDLSILYPATW